METLEDLFDPPQYFPEIDRYRDISIQPDFAPTENNTIEFTIGSYGDPAATILSGPAAPSISGYVRVLTEDNKVLPKTAFVSPCNLFPHALFSKVAVELNHKEISDTSRYYHLKSFISNNFSYGMGAKALTLRSDCFVPDDEEDPIKITEEAPGRHFTTRNAEIMESRKYHFSIKPIFDLSTSNLPLAPGTTLRFIFHRNDTKLPLMSPNPNSVYKIEYHDLKMNIRQFVPAPSCPALKKLNTSTIYYPINRIACNARNITIGTATVTIPLIVSGQLPYHIMMVLLTNDQTNSIDANPYLFKTHNLRSFRLIRNGQGHPEKALEVSGPSANPTHVYKYFLENMGINVCTGDAGPSQSSYFSKDFVMAFNLGLDSCAGVHNHEPLTGKLEVELDFREATTYPLSLFYMAIFENMITITNGDVVKNFIC